MTDKKGALSESGFAPGGRTFGPATVGNRSPIGIEGLDDILGGGLPCDRLYLLQGFPGTGKTTLALQFLREGKARGESVLYITLAESAEELRSTARSHGWDPDDVAIHEHLPLAQQVSETQHTLFHTAEVDLTETMTALLQVIDEVRPRRLVLDSLSELYLLAGSALRYRREVLALKDYFLDRHCTVLLLDDRTTDRNEMQLQSLCHGVLILETVTPEYGAQRRRLQVSKLRGLRFRGGWHDYTIETGGLQVFPRLVASEHVIEYDSGQIASGLAPLDTMFGGGLSRGTTTLLLGPSGTGKSSIATRFALAAAERGERVAMYIFDERPATLFARAAGLNMNLRTHVEAGRVDIRGVDVAELTPGEFTHRVRHAVEEDGVSLVIIDSLAGYMQAMPGTHTLMLHLHELLAYLGNRGVTTLLVVTQHGMLGTAMSGDVDVSYLSDTVLLFRYYEFNGAVRKALSVFKRRSGPHEDAIRQLTLGGPEGIIIGESLTGFRGVLTGVPIYEGTSHGV
jgi:circadian clock protein KaiC